jgi:hypothetical protein
VDDADEDEEQEEEEARASRKIGANISAGDKWRENFGCRSECAREAKL